jgi:hypothetical protein
MTGVVKNRAPLKPEDGLTGYTIPQIAAFASAHRTTVYRWCEGFEMNGVKLKLDTFIQETKPTAGRLVAPKEWARFWAAYKSAKLGVAPAPTDGRAA